MPCSHIYGPGLRKTKWAGKMTPCWFPKDSAVHDLERKANSNPQFNGYIHEYVEVDS